MEWDLLDSSWSIRESSRTFPYCRRVLSHQVVSNSSKGWDIAFLCILRTWVYSSDKSIYIRNRICHFWFFLAVKLSTLLQYQRHLILRVAKAWSCSCCKSSLTICKCIFRRGCRCPSTRSGYRATWTLKNLSLLSICLIPKS